MSAPYSEYLAAVRVLAGQQEQADRGVREAERLGEDELRMADREVAEIKDGIRRAAEVLRTTDQRLARVVRASGLPTEDVPASLRLPTVAAAAAALSELDRDLDRASRSADWVARNRSTVSVAPVRPAPPADPVAALQPFSVGAPKPIVAQWWLWAGVAAILVVVLVVVLLVK